MTCTLVRPCVVLPARPIIPRAPSHSVPPPRHRLFAPTRVRFVVLSPIARSARSLADNPPSDIQGANNMGAPWQSCLVRTGNFHGVHNDDTYPARHVMKDMWTVVNTMLVSACTPCWRVRVLSEARARSCS